MRRKKVKTYLDQINLPDSFAEAHIHLREDLGDDVILLSNGDLGVVYEIDGIYDEPLTEEGLEQEVFDYQKFLRNLVCGYPSFLNPKNVVVQFILNQRDISKCPENSYSSLPVGEFLSAEEKKMFHLGLLKKRFFVCVRYTHYKEKTRFLGAFKNLKNGIQKDIENAKKDFLAFIYYAEEQFALVKKIKRLKALEIVDIIEDCLFAGESKEKIFLDKENISKGIFNDDIRIEGPKLFLNGKESRVFVFSHFPETMSLGEIKTFIRALPIKKFDLVWCFSNGSNEIGQDINFPLAWFSKGTGKRKVFDNLDSFKNSVDAQNPYGKLSIRLIAYDIEDVSVINHIQTVALDMLGGRMVEEKQIPLHLFTSSLPLGGIKEANKIKGRYRTSSLNEAMTFLPVFCGPRADYGKRYWISREGTPVKFDLFAGDGNKMMTVLGRSGAGKSVFMSQVILEFLERFPEGIVRVIDRKTSYTKIADLFGGKVISFSEEALRAKPYSPFALTEWDADDIARIFTLIWSAIVQKNKGVSVTSLHQEILIDALKMAFNIQAQNISYKEQHPTENVPKHPTFMDVLSYIPKIAQSKGIPSSKEAAEDLAAWTISLQQTGQYGFLFSSEEQAEEIGSSPFLVYDLDGIPDDVLRLLSAQMAFGKISRDLARYPKTTPKLLIFEELGMLLLGEDEQTQKANSNFIQNIFKTCRKYGAQGIALTNEVRDFSEKEAGRAIWSQSTQKVFLPLSKDLINNLKTSFPGEFNEADIDIFGSLTLEKNLARSSIYIKSANEICPFVGSIYSPLSPAMEAVASTSPSILSRYEGILKEGKSSWDAISIIGQEIENA